MSNTVVVHVLSVLTFRAKGVDQSQGLYMTGSRPFPEIIRNELKLYFNALKIKSDTVSREENRVGPNWNLKLPPFPGPSQYLVWIGFKGRRPRPSCIGYRNWRFSDHPTWHFDNQFRHNIGSFTRAFLMLSKMGSILYVIKPSFNLPKLSL